MRSRMLDIGKMANEVIDIEKPGEINPVTKTREKNKHVTTTCYSYGSSVFDKELETRTLLDLKHYLIPYDKVLEIGGLSNADLINGTVIKTVEVFVIPSGRRRRSAKRFIDAQVVIASTPRIKSR